LPIRAGASRNRHPVASKLLHRRSPPPRRSASLVRSATLPRALPSALSPKP
jgi:hypothetical protein